MTDEENLPRLGDIHNEPYSERLKVLYKIHETEHIKIPQRTLCHSEEEVRKAIEKYSNEEGSEGSMLKLQNFRYELDGKTLKNIKYKKEFQVIARVARVNEVKGGNAWNYDIVIDEEKLEDGKK